MKNHHIILASLILLAAISFNASAQNLFITFTSPVANDQNVPLADNITITFDQNIDASTLTNTAVVVRGSQTGVIAGVLTGGGSNTITFDPVVNFKPGEVISYTVTTTLLSENAFSLDRGYTFSFTAISGTPANVPVTFAQRHINFRDGAVPYDVMTIDFDRDGDMDIIEAVEASTEFMVLWENVGNQNFCNRTIADYRYAEVHDFDGDGDLDAFGYSGFDNSLEWFENEGGTGKFTKRVISTNDPITITGGDLDNDGDVDILAGVLVGSSYSFRWYSNDGAGSFSTGTFIPSSYTGGSGTTILIADINKDGAMDFLSYHDNAENIVWYRNDGSQNFTEIILANKPAQQHLTAADIDSDDDMDIISAGYSSAALVWLENDGSENFTERTITVTDATSGLKAVCVVDLDGDMDLDLLAGGYWFENDGAQNFTQNLLSQGVITASDLVRSVHYADMDNDRDMDVVTLGRFGLSWQENTTIMNVISTSPSNARFDVTGGANISATFDQPVSISSVNNGSFRVVSDLRGQLSGTFSGDGTTTITFDPATDLFPGEEIQVSINGDVSSTTGHKLEVTFGFDFRVMVHVAAAPEFTSSILHTHTQLPTGLNIADMDADGDIDLLSCSASELYWHQNDGNGNFTAIPVSTTIAPIGVFPIDHNEDGFMDMIVRGSSLTHYYTNDGNQNFTEEIVSGSIVGNIHEVTDINRDGDTDLLFIPTSPNTAAVKYADRNCSSYSSAGFAVPSVANTRKTTSADMDNDGDIDLMGAAVSGTFIYTNNNYLYFPNSSINTSSTSNIELSDLDIDGDLDLILILGTSLVWHENRLTEASQDFGPARPIESLVSTQRSVTTADFDGDGDADIALVSSSNDRVVWYNNRLNESTNNFTVEAITNTDADSPSNLKSGDLNGDGSIDLVVISTVDNRLTVFFNNGASCQSPQILVQPQAATLCEGTDHELFVTATGDGTLTYQWQKDGYDIAGATSSNLNLSAVSANDDGDYQILVTNACGTIPSTVAPVYITTLTAPGVTPAENCGPGQLILTASGGVDGDYRWYSTATGGSAIAGETNSNYTTGEITSSTTFYVSITDGSCESERIPVDAVIWTLPAQPEITFSGNTEICEGSSEMLTAPTGFTYLWSTSESTREINAGEAGAYSVQVIDGNGCTSIPSEEIVLTTIDCSTNEPPVFTTSQVATIIEGVIELDLSHVVTDPDNNIDISSFKIISSPPSGAQAFIQEQLLIISYEGISFTGTESITIEACDERGSCSQQVLTIEVAGDVVVYNAISPNDDGLNDYLIIKHIDIIPDAMQNTLVIYNRWGDQVFESSNYNNTDKVFRGRNENGELLPAGTYYYKLQFSSSRPSKTGYISIR